MFLALMVYNQLSSNNKRKMVVVLVAGSVAILYIVSTGILSSLGDQDIPGLSALALRLNDMGGALDAGDTNALTSNRESLSLLYMTRFYQQGDLSQIFGNPLFFKQIFATYQVASHNFYIDMLIQYGYVGIGMLLLSIISILVHYIRKKALVSFIIAIWFVILFFTRTLPEYYLFFTLIIHDVYARNKAGDISYSNSLQR